MSRQHRSKQDDYIKTGHNNTKRDKKIMVRKSNEQIRNRADEDAEIFSGRKGGCMNVDRIMLERQMTIHNDDDKIIGEVTGDVFDTSDVYDRGMPMRSSHSIRKTMHDSNEHLDFDLHKKFDKRKASKVEYSEAGSGEYAMLDEAMQPITSGSDPYETCVTDINSTTCWMNSHIYDLMKRNNDNQPQPTYVVNGVGLFSGFGVFYLMSGTKHEIELKNYFGYQDKKHLNAGLLTIRKEINRFRDQLVSDIYIINDASVPSNTQIAKKLKNLIFNIVINKNHAEAETERVNNIIHTVSGMKQVVSSNTLTKSNTSMIIITKLSPTWLYKVDKVVQGRTNIEYCVFIGKTFDYYSDAEVHITEIPLAGERYVIGFVKHKNHSDKSIQIKQLTTAINYMKPIVFDEVLVPIIKQRFKTRLNKTLQHSGLRGIFENTVESSLFPEGTNLDDCIEYTDVIFGSRSANVKCVNKGYRTTNMFICDNNAEFYVRDREVNCVLIMGRLR